jgi:cysteine synthase
MTGGKLMNYVNSMLDLIGNTPLLKLNKIGKEIDANIFVKLEYLNPSGSYKDRMALAMIEAAESGDTWNGKKLVPGGIVCDSSAGNTAPALAFVSACKGIRAKIALYRPMLRGDSARMKITNAFGSDVCESSLPEKYLSKEQIETFLEENHDLTYIMAGKMHSYELERNNDDVVWVDQIFNRYNYLGQMGIGYELCDQLDGQIDVFGCSVGSGATLFGTCLGLKEKGVVPKLTYGVVPYGSEVYMQLDKDESDRSEFRKSDIMMRMAAAMGLDKWVTERAIIDEMLNAGYPDKFFRITTEEARDMANRLAKEEGIYCGMSSGANVAVAMKIAQNFGKGKNIVTIIVDRRDRYLAEYPNDVYIV